MNVPDLRGLGLWDIFHGYLVLYYGVRRDQVMPSFACSIDTRQTAFSRFQFMQKALFLDQTIKNYVFLNKIDVAVDKSLCASLKASIACCLGKPMSTNNVIFASVGSGAGAAA